MRYAKRVTKWGWFAAALSIVGLLGAAPADPSGRAPIDWAALKPEDAVPDQILVRFNPAKARVAADGRRALAAHAALGATVKREFKRVPWQVVSLPKGVSLAAAAARYKADPAVVDVVPNTYYHPVALPNDPRYGELWGLPYIGAPETWDVTIGGPDIVVAVIDTGIRYTHADLAPNMWVNPGESGLDGSGIDKATNNIDDDGNGIIDDVHGARWTGGTGTPTSGDPMDGAGHGTHVAGTIGAVGNNLAGVVGVNWNVKLMALKFLPDSGGGSAADAMSAIEYAIEKGAHLSNNSWGGGPFNFALEEMIGAAGAANQLFVAAAGNSASDNDMFPHYPSSYPNDNIIAVASLASDGSMSSFSCYGATSVDIAAPGSDILSTWCTGDTAYNTISGTSMATPHVAGAAALLLSLRPDAPYANVRDAILQSARFNPNVAGLTTTGGDLNLPAAVERFAGTLDLDRLAYRSDATVQATITDGGFAGDTINAAWSTAYAGGVPHASGTFVATRVPSTVTFVGTFTLATGSLASHGDLLTVSYDDSWAYTVSETAPIDDIAPVVSGILIDSPDDGELSVQWTTDERAIGGIRVDQVVPPTAYEASHTVFVADYLTSHAESVTGLPTFTPFYVAVWAEDFAGNRTELPADPASPVESDYLLTATMGGEEIVRYDMERGTSGWTVDNIAGGPCWEHGTPTFGPPVASRCWGTVLDGRYPDGANATLTSPTVTVRSNPVIVFRHWFDIETTPDEYVQILDADCGYVEVLSGGVWHNVTTYARLDEPSHRITGAAADWASVRVVLPDSFANQPLQVRFRFLSDSVRGGRGNPAGWYIDNVVFYDQPTDRIGLSGIEIDDAAPGGDADGAAEPGESVRIRLSAFNASGAPVSVREGSFVLLVGGAVSTQVSLTGGSPAILEYGSLPAGSPVKSGWYDVAVAASTPPGTMVTVLQTLIGSDGVVHQSRGVFRIQNLGPITGTVVSPTVGGDVGVAGATVEAQQSDETHVATTAADGSFALPGTSSNVTYRLSATRGGAQVATFVVAPTNVTLRMELALMDVSPTNIVLTAPIGTSAGADFTVSNRVEASDSLDYSLSIRYEGAQTGWLSITNPASLTGALAPGASTVHSLSASASLPPGTHVAYVDIASNDSDPAPDVVAVTFIVEDVLDLAVAGFRVDDSLTGDGDGMFDPGETADLYISLVNSNAFSVVIGATADLSVIDPPAGATVDGGNPLAWPPLLAGGAAESTGPAVVTWNPPPEQPVVWFRLSGTDGLARPFELDFSITNAPLNSMTGVVTWVSALPLAPAGQVVPLADAVVTAEAVDGTVFASAPTDTNGLYRIDGLEPNAPYWVRLNVPTDSPYVPPAGVNVVATDPVLGYDLQAVNYGTNSPVLRLDHVTFSDAAPGGDGDGAIDPGETLSVSVFVRNVGPFSSLLTTGLLQNAVMHVPDCMTVVDGEAEMPVTVPSGSAAALMLPFSVDVDVGAIDGDFQRFWVTAAVSNTPTLTWPFDFRLDVAPRHSIAGTVTFTDGGSAAKFAAVRVAVTNTLGESAVATPASDGSYRFDGLRPDLDYGVRVSVVPSGYERPDEQFLLLDADKAGIDFVVRPWAIGITPSPIAVTIPEGDSASRTLTVVNGDPSGRDVTLDIRFKRKQVDIIPAPDAVLAEMQANWPVDWTGLNADDYTGEIEIRFADGTPLAEREDYLRRHNLRAVFHFTLVPAVLARPAVGEGVAALAALGGPAALAEPGVVEYVQPTQVIRPQALPSDPRFDELWGLRNIRQTAGSLGADIGAESIWDRSTGSPSVVVAVCDTGVATGHEDLRDNIWWNPLERDGDANGDGFPGVATVDDDGDAAMQVTRRDPVTGVLRTEIPGNWIDDDGDGIIDETGVDFDDEDVMMADYDQDGQLHVVRGWRVNQISGMPEPFEVIDEEDRFLAARDDDENGYVDDFNGWNVALWNHELDDPVDHGTHVAGTIGAVGNNGVGVCGVNWDVSIMVLRLVDDLGNFTTSARIAKAMEYAIRNGARVSNHSWGGPYGAGIMYEVMRRGIEGNHLFVIAAGNDAVNNDVNPSYPAYFSTVLDNVVTVAAADHDDRLAVFSNYGAESVHLAAPGVDILSTVPTGYGVMSGTSMACPHVAGAAALLFSLSPDTTYDVVKAALLEGVRSDPALTGWVKTGGHLDLEGAVQALGSDWLRFDGADLTTSVTVPGNTATNLTLLFNDPPALRRGLYEAVIEVSDFFASGDVPVTLNVTARALPELLDVRVLGDSDGDGYPENGEAVELWVSIRNAGSASLANLLGTLLPVTPGAGVDPGSNTCSYGYVSGLQDAEPDRSFLVSLPASGSPILFDLELRNGATLVATLPVAVEIESRHAVLGRVVQAANPAVGVAGALVEVWGAMGAAAVSGPDGQFAVQGLLPGDYELRAIPAADARSSVVAVAGLAADTSVGDVPVAAPRVALSTNHVVVALQQGMATNVAVDIAKGSANVVDAYAFQTVVSPRRRVALMADGTSLARLVTPLERMGFEVDRYTNNFAVVHYFDPATMRNEIQQFVRYSWDEALLSRYDFIVADVSGPDGKGRPFPDYEADAYLRYLEDGGKVLFTGVNPLSRPDNELLAAILGLGDDAMDRTDGSSGLALLLDPPVGPFVALSNGDRLSAYAGDYDKGSLGTLGAARRIATVGDANKILRKKAGATGAAYLWTGNPGTADWQSEGAWLDILRNILWQDLVADAPVSWLVATPAAGAAPGSLTLALNGDRAARPGTYRATVRLLGPADGEECLPIAVDFTVAPPELRAHNASGQVVDWGGRPLSGDGGERACMLQLLWAGANGVPDAPSADGTPGGDDVALSATDTGLAFGRFGSGYELTPDLGKFDVDFDHPFEAGTPDIVLFARAWDAATPSAAMAYGDSTVRHTLQYLPGESVDFGSWTVDNVTSAFADTNGDGVPDRWTIDFRPELDPRAPLAPLQQRAETTNTNRIGALSAPARLVVSTNFLFVLEKDAHRISVYDRATRALVARYGKDNGAGVTGSGDGEFHTPQGMAADLQPGVFRFAVADTLNHRVQVFTYDPLTGAVTFERKFGSKSPTQSATAENGKFTAPRGVAFTPNGEILVADTGNYRVQRFSAVGGHLGTVQMVSGTNTQTVPEGLCFDTVDGADGFWVADSHPDKDRVAFYALFNTTGIPDAILGATPGFFDGPTDVQLWTVGARQRLCVVDKLNQRIRVIDRDGTPLFDFGSELIDTKTLWLPYGVTPVDGTRTVYVADQGNNRVVWYNLVLDADADGMDDIWEDTVGLDSTVDDASEDPDNDGLPNIGEANAGTDPHAADSDGDGGGDLYEMVNARDPLAADEPFYVPPKLLAFAADPTVVVTGGVVTLTATYDRAPADVVTAYFYTDAGVGRGSATMLPDGSGTNFVCTFQTLGSDLGLFDVEVRCLDQDPPIEGVLGEDAFRVTRPLTATVVCVPDPVAQGQAVTVTVTFDEAVQDAPAPEISLADGATLPATAMVKVTDAIYRYVYTTLPADLGTVNGTVSAAVAAATGEILTPVAFAFVVTPSSIPQVDITAIEFEAPFFLWLRWPAVLSPGDPMQRFEVEYTTSLVPAPAVWTLLDTVDVVAPATEGSYQVNLSTLVPSEPVQCFFRIRRIQ